MHSPHLVQNPSNYDLARNTSAPASSLLDSAPVPPTAFAAAIQGRDIPTTLKDGFYGRQRDGVIAGPFLALDPGGPYAFVSDATGWTQDGRYNAASDEPHPFDVVEVLKARKA